MLLISWRGQNLLRLSGEYTIVWIQIVQLYGFAQHYFVISLPLRVQTSYVTVEPKRNKRVTPPAADTGAGTDQQPYSARDPSSAVAYSQTHQPQEGRPPSRQRREGKRGERELKRARIVITVRRTAAYKQWLDDNPLQAVIAGDGDDEKRTTDTQAEPSDVESKSS